MILINCLSRLRNAFNPVNYPNILTNDEDSTKDCQNEVGKILLSLGDIANIHSNRELDDIFHITKDNTCVLKLNGCSGEASDFISIEGNLPIYELIIELNVEPKSSVRIQNVSIGLYKFFWGIPLTDNYRKQIKDHITNYGENETGEIRIKICQNGDELHICYIQKRSNNNQKLHIWRKFSDTDINFYSNIIKDNYSLYYKYTITYLFDIIDTLCIKDLEKNILHLNNKEATFVTAQSTYTFLMIEGYKINFTFLEYFSIEIFPYPTNQVQDTMDLGSLTYPVTGIKFTSLENTSNINLKFDRYMNFVNPNREKLMQYELTYQFLNISLTRKKVDNEKVGPQEFVDIEYKDSSFHFTLIIEKGINDVHSLNTDETFQNGLKSIELEMYERPQQPSVFYINKFTKSKGVNTFSMHFILDNSQSGVEGMLYNMLKERRGVFGIKVRNQSDDILIDYKIQMLKEYIEVLSCNSLKEHFTIIDASGNRINEEMADGERNSGHKEDELIVSDIHNKRLDDKKEKTKNTLEKKKTNPQKHFKSVSHKAVDHTIGHKAILKPPNTKGTKSLRMKSNKSEKLHVGNVVHSRANVINLGNPTPDGLPQKQSNVFDSNGNQVSSRESNMVDHIPLEEGGDGVKSQTVIFEKNPVSDISHTPETKYTENSIVKADELSEDIHYSNNKADSSAPEGTNISPRPKRNTNKRTIVIVGSIISLLGVLGYIVYISLS